MWIDAPCFPLVQSLITLLATFADTPHAGWCLISGYEEPCLVSSSVVSFSSVPVCLGKYSNWILCSACFTTDWWQSQSNSEFHLEALKGLDDCLSVGKKIDVPTCVTLSYILYYTCLNIIYFSLEFHGMKPKIVTMPPSQASSIHAAPVTFLVLDLAAYQTMPLLLSGLNPFWYPHFSGSLTMHGLWYA